MCMRFWRMLRRSSKQKVCGECSVGCHESNRKMCGHRANQKTQRIEMSGSQKDQVGGEGTQGASQHRVRR
eukprot:123655-Pleurochrysis_carterae.AAC.2